MSEPIVILSTGQSNIASHPALSWTPPANLFLWGWDGNSDADTDIGCSFAPMDDSTMGLGYGFAEQVALANPGRSVYVINIGKGSQPISKWLPGTSAPNMYLAAKQNVEAALVSIGAAKIDYFLWWQGESDWFAGYSTYKSYVSNLCSVLARFRAEAWFPRLTQIAIMAVSSRYTLDPTLNYMNEFLRRVAFFDPQSVSFVDTSIIDANLWDSPTQLLHMTGEGYREAGALAFHCVVHGAGQGRYSVPHQTIMKRVNEFRTNQTVLSDDPELRVFLRSGRPVRVKGNIVGQITGSEDFKWGVSGPATGFVNGVFRIIKADAPSSEAISTWLSGAWYPTNQVINISSDGGFRLEFDLFIQQPTSSGLFSFQWAQNSSGPGLTRVFYGSYMDVIEA